MARKIKVAAIIVTVVAVLLTMFVGCTKKEKTPEEEFSLAKEEVSVIDTQNFYCFKEFLKNVVLKEEGIAVEDLFIKIDYNGNIMVHVLTSKNYSIYTVESKQKWGLANAISSEENFINLKCIGVDGEEIYLQRPFDESIWNAWYYVEGDRIIFEP